jgi:hypothetical protein
MTKMKFFLLRSLDVGGISVLLYTLCTCLLLIYQFHALSLFDHIAYHHTNSEFWVMLWVIFPGALSLAVGILLFQWIHRFQQRKAWNQFWSFINLFFRTYAVLFLFIFAFNVISNKSSWGYFVARPSLHRHVRNAETILTITPVSTISTEQGKTFAIRSDEGKYHQKDKCLYGRRDPYYGNTDRIFMAFQDRASHYPDLYGWFEVYHDMTQKLAEQQLQILYQKIVQTGKLVQSEPGYPDGDEVHGNLVEFLDTHERKWIYAGVGTAQIENDHYAFYEVIFSLNANTNEWEPEVISFQKFFYDVAGMEGVEFNFFPFLGVGGLLLSFLLSGGGMLARYGLEKVRHQEK